MTIDKFETYSSGKHIVYHGNVLDVLPTLADESIDLIFADPPYNIGKRYSPILLINGPTTGPMPNGVKPG